MLKDNNYVNDLYQVIPLDLIISLIEKQNWFSLIKDKDIDFENASVSGCKYDSEGNIFWLPMYFTDNLKLP